MGQTIINIASCVVIISGAAGAIYKFLPKEVQDKLGKKHNILAACAALMLLFYLGCKAGEYYECKNYKEPYVDKLINEKAGLKKEYEDYKTAAVAKRNEITCFLADQLSYAYHYPSEKNKILICQDVGYAGPKLYLPIDNYPDLSAMGFNDKVSSIKIPDNIELRLYKDINYKGEIYPLEKSTPSFIAYDPAWNDAISSIKAVRKQK